MFASAFDILNETSREKHANDALPSSSWNGGTTISHNHDGIIPNQIWKPFLINLIKIGRSAFGLNDAACAHFYHCAFPKFHNDRIGPIISQIISYAMRGSYTYETAKKHLSKERNLSSVDTQLRDLYVNVLLSMGQEASVPTIEIHRVFDVSSLQIVNMAAYTTDNELQETPTLTLAKWCAAVPVHTGSLHIHGSNVFLRATTDKEQLKSQLGTGFMKQLSNNFRILDNFHFKDIRLGCQFAHFDVYITLSAVPAVWTFDTDITNTFVNISTEPYPYDVIATFDRICIAIYIPDTTMPNEMRTECEAYITQLILEILPFKRTTLFTLSCFTQYPLTPYSERYRVNATFDMYHFHKYLKKYESLDDWELVLASAKHIPKVMAKYQYGTCMFIVNRPVLSNVPLIPPIDPVPTTAHIFTKYWSVEDIVQVHYKISMQYSRDDIAAEFDAMHKLIAYRVYNGYLVKGILVVTDTLIELLDKYIALIHLWLGVAVTNNRQYFIKTWKDTHHQRIVRIVEDTYPHRRLNEEHLYFIRNSFANRTNFLNISEITHPQLIVTLIFDYPLQLFDVQTSVGIEVDEQDVLSHFHTIESVHLARELFTFTDKDIINIAEDKYILSCTCIPAVVLIGLNWNATDAAHITKLHERLSRNLIHSIQSVLCKSIIANCITNTIHKI